MVHSLERSAISPHGTWMSYLARYISSSLFISSPLLSIISSSPPPHAPLTYQISIEPMLSGTIIPQMAALPINSINLLPHSLAFHPLALNDSNHPSFQPLGSPLLVLSIQLPNHPSSPCLPYVWKAYSVIYEQPPSISQRALFQPLFLQSLLTSFWIGYHVDSFLPLSPNKTSM